MVDISHLRNMMVLAWDIFVWFVGVIHFHFLFFDTHFLFLKSCTHFMFDTNFLVYLLLLLLYFIFHFSLSINSTQILSIFTKMLLHSFLVKMKTVRRYIYFLYSNSLLDIENKNWVQIINSNKFFSGRSYWKLKMKPKCTNFFFFFPF